MNFYIPHTKKSQTETAYETIKSGIKYQMGWAVSDRRIERLTYISNRHKCAAVVGELGRIEHQYQVAAILEGPLYIIATISRIGQAGPLILVDTKDVLEIQDFTVKDNKIVAPALLRAA